jgi:formylglycine-generating enzyme required for sulfatase activity
LLEALQDGLADFNRDGYITFDELSAYLIPQASNPYQTPAVGVLPGHGAGEYLFTSLATRTAVQPAPLPVPAGARRGATPNSTPLAGDTRVNGKDGLTYVWIPAGTFTMGCSPGDYECAPAEKPAHDVTITKGFWIGQNGVTQEAYQKVTGKNPSGFKGTTLPVENINWNEARSFCQAVGMRLPTEAEWEYAARAGSQQSRYEDLATISWYRDNSANTTHDVGQKPANAWGLYDTLGNVWEWASDWYADQLPATVTDPAGPVSGQ